MNCLPILWRRTLILSAAVALAACSSSSTTNDAQIAGGSGGTTSAGSGGASAHLDAAVASTGGSTDSGVGGSTTSGGGSTGTSNTGVDAAQADRPATGGTGGTGSTVDGGADWSGADAPATDSTQADAPIRDSQGDSQSDVSYLGDRGLGGDAGGKIDAGQSDPYFSNVVLLMHFDGANTATTFTDVKGHVMTSNGSAQTSTAQSAFGGSSGYFDGTSAYLTAPPSDDWNFYAGDFTVELFVYFSGTMASQDNNTSFFGYWGPGTSDQAWGFVYNVNWSTAQGANDQTPGTLYVIFSSTGSDEVVPAVAWTPASNTWYHLAAVRHGRDFMYFVNGTQVGATQSLGSQSVPDWYRLNPESNAGTWYSDAGVAANAAIHANSTAPFSIGVGIGAPGAPNPYSYFRGYIDEARITKGVARYTANFTPPTGAFPDQ